MAAGCVAVRQQETQSILASIAGILRTRSARLGLFPPPPDPVDGIQARDMSSWLTGC
jgi:hypothetical protein